MSFNLELFKGKPTSYFEGEAEEQASVLAEWSKKHPNNIHRFDTVYKVVIAIALLTTSYVEIKDPPKDRLAPNRTHITSLATLKLRRITPCIKPL